MAKRKRCRSMPRWCRTEAVPTCTGSWKTQAVNHSVSKSKRSESLQLKYPWSSLIQFHDWLMRSLAWRYYLSKLSWISWTNLIVISILDKCCPKQATLFDVFSMTTLAGRPLYISSNPEYYFWGSEYHIQCRIMGHQSTWLQPQALGSLSSLIVRKKSLHTLYVPPTAEKLYYMHINLTIHDDSLTSFFFLNQYELDLNLSSYTSVLSDIPLITQELKHGT